MVIKPVHFIIAASLITNSSQNTSKLVWSGRSVQHWQILSFEFRSRVCGISIDSFTQFITKNKLPGKIFFYFLTAGVFICIKDLQALNLDESYQEIFLTQTMLECIERGDRNKRNILDIKYWLCKIYAIVPWLTTCKWQIKL